LHQVAVAQVLPTDPDRTDAFIQRFQGRVSAEDTQLFYQIALNGRRDQALSPDPRSGFEMTLVRMLAFRPAQAPRDSRQTNSAAPATGVAGPSPRVTARVPVSAEVKQEPQPQLKPDPASAQDPGEWQQIIDEMALAGLVRELAGHCVLKAHTQDKVHLILAPVREHLLKTSQKERLQKAIRDRFGEKVKLEITVEEIAGETPAQRRQREERQRQQEAVAAYSNDPGVRTIMENFNADLQADSIRIKHPASGSEFTP